MEVAAIGGLVPWDATVNVVGYVFYVCDVMFVVCVVLCGAPNNRAEHKTNGGK